jgi:hypothetical protein
MLCGATVFPTSDVRTNIILLLRVLQKDRRQIGHELNNLKEQSLNKTCELFQNCHVVWCRLRKLGGGLHGQPFAVWRQRASEWVSVPLYGCRWHTSWVAGRSWKEVWRLNTFWLDGFCVRGTNVTPVHSVSAPESPSRPSVAGATPVTSSTSSTPTSVVTEPSSGLRPSASLPSYSLFPSFAERWVATWCHAMTLRILLLLFIL